MRAVLLPVTLALAAVLLCSPARAETVDGPGDLVEVSAQRIAVAEAVAAAKWHSGSAVDDPEREADLLAAVELLAVDAGLAPDTATTVARDQIEANKLVQRGLHARWYGAPSTAPTREPDLADLRPVLDRLTRDLVGELRATEEFRAHPACVRRLDRETRRVAAGHGFDSLRTTALVRSLPSVCG